MDLNSLEEQQLIHRSGRILGIAFGAVGALFLAFLAAVIVSSQLGGGLSAREAMNRCTASPPGFPERLKRARITTTWSFVPPGYTCVYSTPGTFEEHPASATCLTSPGWCREP